MTICRYADRRRHLVPATLAATAWLVSGGCTGGKSATKSADDGAVDTSEADTPVTPPSGDGSVTPAPTVTDLLSLSLVYPATLDASVPVTQVIVRPSGDATCRKTDHTGAKWSGELAALDTTIPDLLSRPGLLTDLATGCSANVTDAGPFIASRFANDDTTHRRLVAFSCLTPNLDALEQAMERIGDACIAGAKVVPPDDTRSADAGRDATDEYCLGKPDCSDGGRGDGGGGLCFWQTGGGYNLNHFRFLLTKPDGQVYVPKLDGYFPKMDAGNQGIEVFEGRIASVEGNQFTVDRCLTTATCQPSLYQFTLCSSGHDACAATDLPPSLPTVLPPNRRVRVEWSMEPAFPPTPVRYWLAVYDAEPVASPGTLLFVGAGGYQPDYYGAPGTPLATLPFTVALRSLKCEELRTGIHWGNDYAFLFTSPNVEDPPLRVASGETGNFSFTSPSGPKQSLEVRCLVAVQPQGVTGDYYNWDFWATNATPLASPAAADSGH